MTLTFDATLEDILRPEAAHTNLNGSVNYAPRSPRGKMDFGYEVIRLWERPAEELLSADLGVTPLAVLGRLPGDSVEEGLAIVASQLVERLIREASGDRVSKMLTDAFLLSGLRVRRDMAARIFRGVQLMHESDTYLAILDEGREEAIRESILMFGEELFGPPAEWVKAQLGTVTDLDRLRRMVRRTAKAASWQEVLDTP